MIADSVHVPAKMNDPFSSVTSEDGRLLKIIPPKEKSQHEKSQSQHEKLQSQHEKPKSQHDKPQSQQEKPQSQKEKP